MNVDTYRSLVLLTASAAMTGVVAWWLAWTTRRHTAELERRRALAAAIDETIRHWGGYLIWLTNFAYGDGTDSSHLWGPHLHPQADDKYVGDAAALRVAGELRDEILARGYDARSVDARKVAHVERALFDALEAQRERAVRGEPLRELTAEERAELLDADAKLDRIEARIAGGPEGPDPYLTPNAGLSHDHWNDARIAECDAP